ncbi:RING-type domain-containing protein [Mycena kentingensis (nom. inval.)]|nr:RING-type domain-containing protein [Mycena kentingensis (nom. inval.)]
MASREPMWFCHECDAEMRPLMVPDPVCASCRSSFVEKMEDPTDDPRQFHRGGGLDFGGTPGDMPLGLEAFLYMLQGAATQGSMRQTTTRGNSRTTRTFELRNGPGGTSRTVRTSNGALEDPDQPTMADFLQRSPSDGEGGINGSLMARYLMALLGRDGGEMLGGQGPQAGRMGDYVFNQEALDQIITQLMESSNASRPVAATDEIVEKLPREVLEEGSPMLEKDCAVCKDQFKLETDDPDEQIVVTLPCKHPFHEPCILPWLKSSGTCPVCRFALIPQPDHHGPPPSENGEGGSSSRRSPSRTNSGSGNGPTQGSLFQSILGHYSPGGGGGGGQSNSRTTRRHTSDSNSNRTRNNIPGGWEEDLD